MQIIEAVICVAGYLIGSIPFGYLYSKHYNGLDLRKFGSHSTGTTNVLRYGSKKLAFITLMSDIFKGSVTAFASCAIYGYKTGLITSFCCVVGHVYPIWLKFKGGKGAATTAGTFIVLAPMYTLFSGLIWVITARITKISSLASLVFCLSFNAIIIFRFIVTDMMDFGLFFYSISMLLFLMYTHRDNIKRLMRKKENTF
jgi:glycerol-3-phosphate acyltransferase PlsY